MKIGDRVNQVGKPLRTAGFPRDVGGIIVKIKNYDLEPESENGGFWVTVEVKEEDIDLTDEDIMIGATMESLKRIEKNGKFYFELPYYYFNYIDESPFPWYSDEATGVK